MDKARENKDKELFDVIADDYSRKDNFVSSRAARKFQLFSVIDEALKINGGKKFKNVLELGCGSGASAIYLENHFEHYTGIDYSKDLIKNAAARNIGNTEFICANIKDFEPGGRKFDMVLMVGVLHHVDDVDSVLSRIRYFGDSETVFCFIEPQSGNPVIGLLRAIRKITDKKYSDDQVFFRKKDILRIFKTCGYTVEKIKFQGYFSTPFAQVILKPKFISYPITLICIAADRFIQKFLNNPLSWNIVWAAKKAATSENARG